MTTMSGTVTSCAAKLNGDQQGEDDGPRASVCRRFGQLTDPVERSLSGAVDFTIAVRGGDETAHRAPSITRKELSNVDGHRQRSRLVAEAHDGRRGRRRCHRHDACSDDDASGRRAPGRSRENPAWRFAELTFTGAVLGGILVAVLNRRSILPRRRFIQIAVTLTALSCLAPAVAGDDASSKIGLIAIHLLAATIIAPVLARQTSG